MGGPCVPCYSVTEISWKELRVESEELRYYLPTLLIGCLSE